MNPETRYTNRIRKRLIEQFPRMKIYKHSDRFNGGIADLHLTMPFGNVAWIEVKYMKSCKRYRKAGVTTLQAEFLKEHWANGLPAYVLIGVGKQSAYYRIDRFDGWVYGQHLGSDQQIERMIYDMEGICSRK